MNKVLLVGRAPDWGQRASEYLISKGINAICVAEVSRAVQIVKEDKSVTVVIFAEDHDKDTLLSGMARMVLARPDLPMVVLSAEYDLMAMVKYLQLGQREAGVSQVRYLPNDYNLARLECLIRSSVPVPVAATLVEVSI